MSSKTMTIHDQANTLADQLAEAEAVLAARQTELTDTLDQLSTITRAWETGDDSHTADDLARTQAEHTRIEALANAATLKVERLRSSQINLDLALAQAMTPIVSKMLKGRVPVEVNAGKAPQTAVGRKVPKVVLTQAKAATNRGGGLSGEFELTYLRDDLMTPFPFRDLEDFALTQQAGIEVKFPRIGNGVGSQGETLDWAKVRVGWAFSDKPVIVNDPTTETVKDWGRDLAGVLAQCVAAVAEPVHYLGEATDRSTGSVLAATILSSTVAKGQRTTEVSVELLIDPRRADYNPEILMKDTLDQVPGSAARGLGHCTEAQTRVGLYSGLAHGHSTNRRVVYIIAKFVSAMM